MSFQLEHLRSACGAAHLRVPVLHIHHLVLVARLRLPQPHSLVAAAAVGGGQHSRRMARQRLVARALPSCTRHPQVNRRSCSKCRQLQAVPRCHVAPHSPAPHPPACGDEAAVWVPGHFLHLALVPLQHRHILPHAALQRIAERGIARVGSVSGNTPAVQQGTPPQCRWQAGCDSACHLPSSIFCEHPSIMNTPSAAPAPTCCCQMAVVRSKDAVARYRPVGDQQTERMVRLCVSSRMAEQTHRSSACCSCCCRPAC